MHVQNAEFSLPTTLLNMLIFETQFPIKYGGRGPKIFFCGYSEF